jgi:MFS family permease
VKWMRGPNQAILLICLCTFLGALLFYQPVSVLYLGSRGLSLGEVLLLESFLLVAMLLTEVPSGYVSDLVGCKWIMVVGFALAAIGQLLYATATGFTGFAVSSALYGMSIACLSGARDTYIMGHLERLGRNGVRHTGDLYGRLNALGLSAGIVSSLAGAQLARRSLQLPAIATAIAAGLALLIAVALPPPPRDVGGTELQPSTSWLVALRDVARSPVLLYFAVTPTYALFASVTSIAQVKLAGFHVEVGWLGVLFAAAALLAAAASNNAGRLAQRWGTDRVHGVVMLGAGIAYLAGALPGPLAIIVSMVLAAVCMNVRLPISSVIMNAHVTPAMRATMLSMCGLISGIVGALINPAIGYLADRSTDLALVVVGLVLFGLAAVWYAVSASTARPGVLPEPVGPREGSANAEI